MIVKMIKNLENKMEKMQESITKDLEELKKKHGETKIKHRERILKAAREKQQVAYKGNPICLIADLSAGTLQARREWQDIFKVLKGKSLQPRLLYQARISFKIDGEIKSFSDKQKLREFSTTKPALQQTLNDLNSQEIQKKKKDLQNQQQTVKKWQ